MEIKLPLRLSESEVGSVVDADGHEVFVVDVHRDLPDEEVVAIAKEIIAAVNGQGEGDAH